MEHHIKLNIEFCDAVVSGAKNFEIRENDRGYQKGDTVRFTPYDRERPIIYHAIQRKVYEITYVLNGWGLKNGFVVFGIREATP